MKAIKTLLAVSALAAAGVANAATIATFTYDDLKTTYGVKSSHGVVSGPDLTVVYGTSGGSGSGSLDDTGTLVLNIGYYFQNNGHATHQFDATETVTYTGTIDLVNNIFNSTTVTNNILSCVNTEVNGCANVHLGSSTTVANKSFSLINPTVDSTNAQVTGQPAWQIGTTTYTPTLTAPAVPIPAAAWLFGSGLLGLVGTKRRCA